LLISKQNPIRARPATKIRYFSDRLLGACLLNPGRVGFETPKTVIKPDAANRASDFM
jgi:hypothetical protein